MSKIFDAFWRAFVYCWMPKVIVLALLPLALILILALGLGYFVWHDAVAVVSQWLDAITPLQWLLALLGDWGLGAVRQWIAPLLLVLITVPLLILLVLALVSLYLTPKLTQLVAQRRFVLLERKQGAGWWQSLIWTVCSIGVAAGMLLLSLPLWFIPPLAIVLPALINGWLTYRLMAFDALADFASASERDALLAQHRLSLLGMGVAVGLLGLMPGLLWVSGVFFALTFVVFVPLSIWLYTIIFVFSSLWFAHYALAALEHMREFESVQHPDAVVDMGQEEATTSAVQTLNKPL